MQSATPIPGLLETARVTAVLRLQQAARACLTTCVGPLWGLGWATWGHAPAKTPRYEAPRFCGAFKSRGRSWAFVWPFGEL
ncbi:uncharacterized protein P174DRAFT_440295 [Aspergillus novofumigatus IBT 16806]|uniref:Uncharacterized protein n=1 Tax=Aspergillus novofumigatus (strain IBT 16806) TaxID=1392255 RepID=A0A2I1CDJ3_ASPN1|nr:uncharacterized protein P174DRAFT_440295 [Aspergillus novofumigatus IBT 16806]PKX95695.1 hypothetical protein P174DRAFT_440295 [Aspergillus novofumigatus IBT 16806]